MATSKEFLYFILEQLNELNDITYRQMMGEYIIYYRGKIVSYLCDNRCLIKPTAKALKLLANCQLEAPYKGAKDMILLEEINPELLKEIFETIYDELPEPKIKKKTTKS